MLQTEGVEASLAGVDMTRLPEYGRRDYTLSPSNSEPMLASQEWPTPEQPSLDNPRYVYINTNANTMMFFRPSSSQGPFLSYWRWYGW